MPTAGLSPPASSAPQSAFWLKHPLLEAILVDDTDAGDALTAIFFLNTASRTVG
jgi:hypothetical protein